MKKILLFILTLLTVNIYAEKIEKFEYIVSVNEDKSLHIIENIDYNPEDEVHHGIIRDIITKNSNYKFFKFNDKIAIKNFKSNFETRIKQRSKYTSYRLGSPNIYLPTNETTKFILEYDLYNVVRTNEDIFQIYLNATGNFWDMPIENVEIRLDVKPSAIKDLYVYSGVYGENTENYIVKDNVIKNKRPLQENEGITFKLNLDKHNPIYSYTTKDKLTNILEVYPVIKINVFVGIMALILIILSVLKKMKNKDNIPIMPEFVVDDKISPAMCYKIYGKSTYDILTIVFLSLVSKGLIKEKNRVEDIEYVIKKGEKIENVLDYNQKWEYENEKVYSLVDPIKIEKALSDKDLLSAEEKQVIVNFYRYKEDIFSSYTNIANLNVETKKLVDKIYSANIGRQNIIYPAISMILLFVLAIANILFSSSFELTTLLISLLITIVSFVVSSNILILTEEGKKAYRNVKGFLMYFEKVETNVFRTLKTEKEIVEYAKKMLPYAVAVGIEAKFIDLLNKELSVRNIAKSSVYPYIYYPYFVNIHTINNEIGELIRENTRIQNANARHSSGGGFSGGSGGFSGGGFSGGGGSSW